MNGHEFEIDKKTVIIGIAVTVLVAVLLVVGAVLIISPQSGKAPESTHESTAAEDFTEDTSATTAPAETGSGEDDPENREPIGTEGAPVDASSITSKKGLARGIDVSRWQGKIDWQAVSKSGIDLAYIRIGYRGENGKIYKDENADYNLQKAEEAGILTGVYFYTNACTEAEALEEARWTLDAIAGYSISYPVVYDCEGFNSPQSRMYFVSAKQRTANALAFLSAVTDGGYEAMLYGARDELINAASWNISEIEKSYSIWIAHYPAVTYPEKNAPDYSGRCDAWQYTNKGTVRGIEGSVDMLICYFERAKAEPKNAGRRPANAEPPRTDEEMQYTAVNEKVTAKDITNLRSGATTKSSIVGTLKNGEVLTRVATGANGWSKLLYNGATVYAITSYLTTDLTLQTEPPADQDIVNGQTFAAREDSVTAKEVVNLRSEPNTSSEIKGTLKNGEFLQRTAVGDKGWSRLEYNGETVYAVTNYLTTEKPEEQTTDRPADTTAGYGEFREANDEVTAKQATNLRDAPSTTTGSIVYTLKNGEFVKRTGISDKGWSRLEYNGKTVYAVTSYLTTEKPAETTDTEIAETDTDKTETEAEST